MGRTLALDFTPPLIVRSHALGHGSRIRNMAGYKFVYPKRQFY